MLRSKSLVSSWNPLILSPYGQIHQQILWLFPQSISRSLPLVPLSLLTPSSCLHRLPPGWLKQSPDHSSLPSVSPLPHLCLQSIPNTATRWFLLSQRPHSSAQSPFPQRVKARLLYYPNRPLWADSPLFFWLSSLFLSPLLSLPAIMASSLFFKCEVLCTFVDHIG